ncbi:hypothetical protein BOQ60_25130, partial [Chryseobacterium sp. CH1]
MFGTWTQLSRYDDLDGAAGKVSYTVNLKDVSGSKAAKASFQVAGITRLAGQAGSLLFSQECLVHGPSCQDMMIWTVLQVRYLIR